MRIEVTPGNDDKLDILCFSSSDWFGNWGSRQQVMRRLGARGHRVLYVEQMAGLEHLCRYPELRRRRVQRRRTGLQEIEPNVWLHSPPPLLPGRYYSRTIARINARIVSRGLEPQLERLNFRRPILWLYLPEHAPLIGQFGERVSVYHCIDEWSVGASGHKRKTVVALEKELVGRASVVFANSQLTYENKIRWNDNTHRIPSGVDIAHFANAVHGAPAADELASLPHPLLMFAGNINEKIDVPLLASIARERPAWSIVLVGGHNARAVSLDTLDGLPNVHLLGERPFDEIPSLMSAADVCLLPYTQGESTRYRSPLKLYEYLATGRPVVSTPHPEVEEWSRVVTIAMPSEFVDAIEKTIENDTPANRERRLRVAKENSWDTRIDTMEIALSALTK